MGSNKGPGREGLWGKKLLASSVVAPGMEINKIKTKVYEGQSRGKGKVTRGAIRLSQHIREKEDKRRQTNSYEKIQLRVNAQMNPS